MESPERRPGELSTWRDKGILRRRDAIDEKRRVGLLLGDILEPAAGDAAVI